MELVCRGIEQVVDADCQCLDWKSSRLACRKVYLCTGRGRPFSEDRWSFPMSSKGEGFSDRPSSVLGA